VLTALSVGLSSFEAVPQVRNHRILRLAAADRGRATSIVARLRRDSRFRFASTAFRGRDLSGDAVLVNRVVVQFKDGVTQSQIDSLNAALGTRIVRSPAPDSGFTAHWLRYPAESEPLKIAAQLDRHPLVAWASPDMISDQRPLSVPFDPFYSYQFWLRNTSTRNGVPINIDVERAWDLTKGTEAIRVAIIDDGIDINHPEYSFRNAQYYDSFQGAACADGQPGSAANPCAGDVHGTHVAGVLTAPHNSIGVAGVAPNVYLVFARIFRDRRANSTAEIAYAISWSWQSANADVISNSWGGGLPDNGITNAINNATARGRAGRGAVVVFAAGNFSNRCVTGYVDPVLYPANLSAPIAVAAINQDGNVACYSNGGSQIDIAAFGSRAVGSTRCGHGDMVSTDLSGPRGCNDAPGGDIDYGGTFGGTSAAAPQVAGVAALLLTREPNLTYQQVRARLFNFADPWGAANDFGAGKLNAYRTLTGM